MDQAKALETAAALTARYGDVEGAALLRGLLLEEFPGRAAVLSSFGAESAVLLALVAEIDPATPVITIDTGKLFPETIEYRDHLVEELGLTGLRIIGPSGDEVTASDPDGILWYWDPDRCCGFRKVVPLARALEGFDLVVSGRKRYHGALRKFLPQFEAVDGRIKVDPIAHWSPEQVEAEFTARALPRHPLVAEGYPSIGCAPCTAPAEGSGDVRAGRWAGKLKTECGIHLSASPPHATA
jgi:phosphoadenosine phosphosulfate reductase